MKKSSLALLTTASITASQYAAAFERGNLIIRVGLTTVSPDEYSSNIFVGSDLGVNVSVNNNTQLGLNIAYFLTNNINIEVLAATPFMHDVNFGVSASLGTGDKLGT